MSRYLSLSTMASRFDYIVKSRIIRMVEDHYQR